MRLFDTGFLIDLVDGDEGAVKKATQVDEEKTFSAISVVTVHEYLRGIFYLHSRKPAVLEEKLRRAESDLARFEILPYTYDIARAAAEIDAGLTKRGISLSFADVIIASTALHYRLTVVTRNIEHFRRVPKLSVEVY